MPKPENLPPVVVIGAGFSGTLLTIHLLRLGASVVLVERSTAAIGKGLAFGTRRPEHLLNVRAANMSAFPDDPGHFIRWMGFSDREQRNRFVPRLAYGQYLREQLMAAIAGATGRIRIVSDTATGIDTNGRQPVVTLAHEPREVASAVILAAGNLAPSLPEWMGGMAPDTIIADPWIAGALDRIDHARSVVIAGSGLTAIDVIMSLVSAGHTGRITAISRRGLIPRAHARAGPVTEPIAMPQQRGASLVKHIRRRARQIGWQAAVDELRPHTQALWRAHDHHSQARLLRHLKPFWEVHRHRLAPSVEEQLDRLRASGQLRFVAGRLLRAQQGTSGLEIAYRPRGHGELHTMPADVVINCTGPEGNLARVANPLLRDLLAQGLARSDRHRLGLDVDEHLHLVGGDGRPVRDVYAVGPLTRGGIWEMVAVPDIRVQVWQLARRLNGKVRSDLVAAQ